MDLTEMKRKMLPVLKREGVKRAAFFGSFVRGEQKGDSDVDLLVELEEEKSLLDLVGLKMELEEVLGREVDLLTYNSLHPLLKNEILREQRVIL
ncbi:MAG: type VII toxin-antitoxin system MntA family adenylyltransferase antitoxin [Thermoproteota archaeon]